MKCGICIANQVVVVIVLLPIDKFRWYRKRNAVTSGIIVFEMVEVDPIMI